jgi:E3 ubiquitin-protein ligase HECTD2
VGWFARFSESHFQKLTDLVGGFVTYRLTRQHRRNQPVSRDHTAELIPSVGTSGRETSAALHAVLGVPGQPTKISDDKSIPVAYCDDWQIKAAARVMALFFAANVSGIALRNDVTLHDPTEAVSSVSWAPHDRAQRHGQIIPTSDFYNTFLDYSDLIADFEAWEARRVKFTFCQYPFFLSIWAKIQIMEHDTRRQMEVKAREAFFDSITTRKAVNQYLILRVRRECLVEDSLKGVSEVVGTGGGEIKKGLRIEFKGEEGIDAGGLRKEWFLLLVRDVFNPEHGVLVKMPEFFKLIIHLGMFTYDEDSQLCYFSANSFETSDQFFLVGVVLGLAIYNSTILDIAFPHFAFRKLLAAGPSVAPGSPPHAKPMMTYTLDDLAEFRPALANGLQQLLEFEGDVESIFCRDFVADVERYGQVVQVPLCPGGEKKAVTNANRREFVDLYVRYLLDISVSRQFEPFKRGFFTVCGGNALSLFRPEEIELLIRGSDEPLDIASLRAVAIYENWGVPNPAETEPVIVWFWQSFEKAKPDDQRKLLGFITGSDRIPAMGAANLVIKLSCLGKDSLRFPVARTCFNMLSLWRYDSYQKLERMLWRAVGDSEGFGLK